MLDELAQRRRVLLGVEEPAGAEALRQVGQTVDEHQVVLGEHPGLAEIAMFEQLRFQPQALEHLPGVVAARLGDADPQGEEVSGGLLFLGGVGLGLELFDSDLAAASAGLVDRRDREDIVIVEDELHVDPRRARFGPRDSRQPETADLLVLRAGRRVALEDDHVGAVGVVAGGGERTVGLGRQRCSPGNQHAELVLRQSNPQGASGDVRDLDGSQVFFHAAEVGGHDRRPLGHHRVDVVSDVGLDDLVGQGSLDQGHARRSAHQHHTIDVVGRKLGVADRLHRDLDRAAHQIGNRLFVLLAGDGHAEQVAGDQTGDLHLDLLGAAEFLLGCLGRFLQLLVHPARVDLAQPAGQARILAQPGEDQVDQPLVKVLASEVGGPADADHLEVVSQHFEDGDVERPSAEVVDQDRLIAVLVHSVGDRRGAGLGDQTEDVQAGSLPGQAGVLLLIVGEVGRHADHDVLHLFAEILAGGVDELAQNEAGDLDRAVLLPAQLDAVIAVAHVSLDGQHGLVGVDQGAFLGLAADQHPSVPVHGDGGGHHRPALHGAHLHPSPPVQGNRRVARSQVDSQS